jgi:hypothetical protein
LQKTIAAMIAAAKAMTTIAGQIVSRGLGTHRARWNAAAFGQRRSGDVLSALRNARRSRRGMPDQSADSGFMAGVQLRPLTAS